LVVPLDNGGGQAPPVLAGLNADLGANHSYGDGLYFGGWFTPPGGQSPPPPRSAKAQALGRSRGGLSTKVIVAAADEDTALAVDVVPGQAHDAPLLVPMLDRTLARVEAVDELVGDRALDGDELRCECIERDVNPNIPLRANRDPES